jgi:rubrerythrin
VVRPRYKPVTPDQRIRQLRKEFRTLEKQETGPDRAAQLAEFTRSAHEERQLNMAMHTAARCLEEDPQAPDLLVRAYTDGVEDTEDRLRAYVDLEDLARYVERPDLTELAERRIAEDARAWIREADEAEQRHRLRTLTSMISREFADTIRDELRFL